MEVYKQGEEANGPGITKNTINTHEDYNVSMTIDYVVFELTMTNDHVDYDDLICNPLVPGRFQRACAPQSHQGQSSLIIQSSK